MIFFNLILIFLGSIFSELSFGATSPTTSSTSSTSSTNTTLSTLATGAMITSSLMGILIAGGTIASLISGFAFSDKSTILKGQKYAKELIKIKQTLPSIKNNRDKVAAEYNDLAVKLSNLNSDDRKTALDKVVEQKTLTKQLKLSEKKFDVAVKQYQDSIDRGEVLSAYLDAIEKKVGGSIKSNFLTKEAQDAINKAAIEVMGTTSFTKLTNDQITAIEAKAIENIEGNKLSILQRAKKFFSRSKKK